jgi:hypothetical protein
MAKSQECSRYPARNAISVAQVRAISAANGAAVVGFVLKMKKLLDSHQGRRQFADWFSSLDESFA